MRNTTSIDLVPPEVSAEAYHRWPDPHDPYQGSIRYGFMEGARFFAKQNEGGPGQYFPDGWGWSKLNGYYYAYRDKLYWCDGDVTDNKWPHVAFTGIHGLAPLNPHGSTPPKALAATHNGE